MYKLDRTIARKTVRVIPGDFGDEWWNLFNTESAQTIKVLTAFSKRQLGIVSWLSLLLDSSELSFETMMGESRCGQELNLTKAAIAFLISGQSLMKLLAVKIWPKGIRHIKL